jgi:m7GpppX diphosphatase
MVTETPQIYRNHVHPYIQRKRDEGRLDWVFNILEGRTEQEDVVLREAPGTEDGFLMLPDLNWDRKSMGSLHLLALVERRDLWSLRDLRKRDVAWLKGLRSRVVEGVGEVYGLDGDQLKLYVHCEFG